MEDLSAPDEICEMCEFAEIRYVHIMQHPDYPETLRVGCVCAENMGDEYARDREKDFRKESRARKANPEKAHKLDAMEWLLEDGNLNEWERGFMESLADRFRRARKWEPTFKQWRRFQDILRREIEREKHTRKREPKIEEARR
jgi:hypothetical protein